jgi:hypothetical protein
VSELVSEFLKKDCPFFLSELCYGKRYEMMLL